MRGACAWNVGLTLSLNVLGVNLVGILLQIPPAVLELARIHLKTSCMWQALVV
jgi:hypothetical protein